MREPRDIIADRFRSHDLSCGNATDKLENYLAKADEIIDEIKRHGYGLRENEPPLQRSARRWSF